MVLFPELEKRYPVLMGHSVVIIDSPKAAGELSASLRVNQQMEVDFVEETDFPDDLAEYMEARRLESSIIHVPGVATSEGADNYKKNVFKAYAQRPRMIILEGFPVGRETITMYEDFRRAGIPMVDKFPFAKIIGTLAQLFT